VVKKEGEDHNPTFEVKCVFKEINEIGKGSSIKIAKEEAARKIVNHFSMELENLSSVSFVIESYNVPLSDIWDNKCKEVILTLQKKTQNTSEVRKFKVQILNNLSK
ncbi:MAG: putative dsRNA-binding protein, partial [Paraclostridium dentum]|uniref:putative dsRNA-binding protein n=1 Tax=Paraclostridium dentum TaxID=2662455 RepID=UPI003EE4B5CE